MNRTLLSIQHLPETAFFKISHFFKTSRKLLPCHHFVFQESCKVPQNFKNWLRNNNFTPENNRDFSIVKLSAREVTIFPEKIYFSFLFFYLKCTKPKHFCIVCIAECQTLKIFPQICLNFNLKVFGLPPLHTQTAYSK